MFRVKNGRFPAFASPISLEIGINERWAILGSHKREALDIVAGKHVADPPTALTYPAFGKDVWPSQAIQLVRFGASVASARAPYLSARYESFRDEFDFTLREMLVQQQQAHLAPDAIDAVADKMHLSELMDRWIVSLSNGQKRRAQLAMALLKEPRLLLVDEPFLGLDAGNRELMSQVLHGLEIPVVLGLRGAGEVPSWVSHLALATSTAIESGPRHAMAHAVAAYEEHARSARHVQPKAQRTLGEPVIELKGINVAYRGNHVLKDFHLSVRRGERVHIAGSNGSGKTTLLAMLTADHPQSWNDKVVLFGEPREVGKHDYFGIQEQIGHSSPEIHAIFPRRLTVQQAILTGFTGTRVGPENPTADQIAAADKMAGELGLDAQQKFGDCSLAEQKLVLFGRALVRNPPILILDEAFSTLLPDQLAMAMAVLDSYEGTALIVGHVPEEIPPCDQKVDLGSSA